MEVTTTSTSQGVYTKKHKPALFLEKEIIHSHILAWEILWTEEPSGLQPMESQRVGRVIFVQSVCLFVCLFFL